MPEAKDRVGDASDLRGFRGDIGGGYIAQWDYHSVTDSITDHSFGTPIEPLSRECRRSVPGYYGGWQQQPVKDVAAGRFYGALSSKNAAFWREELGGERLH